MPRHGSTATGVDIEAEPLPPTGRSITHWPIRRKLTLLVTIPLVALAVGGGVLVTRYALDYWQARQARSYADDVQAALRASEALSVEFSGNEVARDQQQLRQARSATDQRVQHLQPVLRGLAGADDETGLPDMASEVSSELDELANKRRIVDGYIAEGELGNSQDRVRSLIERLSEEMSQLVSTLIGELDQTTPSRETTARARAVVSLATASSEAESERILLADLISRDNGSMDATEKANRLSRAASTQDISLENAQRSAAPAQADKIEAVLAGSQPLIEWRRVAQELLVDRSAPPDVNAWTTFASERGATIRALADESAAELSSTARGDETSALLRAVLILLAVLLLIGAVTGLLATIARSVTAPLRRLRSGAVEVASVQLPAAVARIQQEIQQDGTAEDIQLPPVLPDDAAAGPDAVEVARAVDELGAEAVRLATSQVRLRRALDEAFVGISRRSQAMVEKQLGIIDRLESQEQDPDQLRELFQLDHLAARMRRYNDNLLVLAGSAVRTRVSSPLRVAELFRAATSEMDEYERVRLRPVSRASVSGTVAGELVHLLAELLDNAAMYSSPSSPILLSGAFTPDGGLQVEVVDGGVGIGAAELGQINARLSQPEAVENQVPSQMGLFVVARLARRGGFAVQLIAPPDAPGTIAMVGIPANLVIGAPGQSADQPPVPADVSGSGTPPAARNGATPDTSHPVPDGDRGSPLPRRPKPVRPAEQDDTTAPAAAAAGQAEVGAGDNRATPATIGEAPELDDDFSTPIFDSISAWFADNPTGEVPVLPSGEESEAEPAVIDLRDGARSERTPSRWSALDDREWLAASAQASAEPDTAGTTETGLPRRRPGANLLPSAAAVAGGSAAGEAAASDQATGDGQPGPPVAPGGRWPAARTGADAEAVRGRLSEYQRRLADARRSGGTPKPTPAPVGASLFQSDGDSAEPDDGD